MFGKVHETPQRETTTFHPRSPYGVSKVAGFYLSLNYREAYNIPCSNGILFNHESPRRGYEFVTRKITDGVARIKLGLANELLLGNLEAKRDWGHARDFVRAMHLMLQQPEADDYVVATGETHSVREFCELAFGEVNLDYRDFVRKNEAVYRPAEVDLLIGDFSKARKQLGWEPTVNFAGLVRDSKGNFYGATSVGGSAGLGTVYKLRLTSAGWKESVLHSFTGTPDGAEPLIFQSALTLDGLGDIYGTTYTGGAGDGGTVFELIPQTSGAWTEKILVNFQRTADGFEPLTGVILDKSGNVYGTTVLGGTQPGSGTVFELTAANGYAKTILHNFNIFTDLAKETPHGLILDASGNLYGTTEYALYKLTHESNGWSETVLWVFGNLQDGGANTVYEPAIMDAQGHFWGATLWGGPAGATTGGTAWEIIP